jgi:thiol-disulfide isomerase/thioredoxin
MRWTFLVLAGALAVGGLTHDVGAASVAPLTRLDGAQDWLNGGTTSADLKGDVVVVDVFTVDCYNCQNVVPTLRSLYAVDRARGLRVIGIHAPETPAERSRTYVAQSLTRQGIVWPVAIDNDFALWHAYDVDAWPTELFFDRHGVLRDVIVGDSQDRAVRATVESLLRS